MRILIALGGNAILRRREAGTIGEQLANVDHSSRQLVQLIKNGNQISITHGNGPQVGDILLRNDLSRRVLPPDPLDVCGAESQGMIGYMLQQSLGNELKREHLDIQIAAVLTQTLVDRSDPAFESPTKPIGPYYTESEAEILRNEKSWVMADDSRRGFRRVVPSPLPKSIVEAELIEKMFRLGFLIIHSGGGGIPVVERSDGSLSGVEAVIDKDLTAGLLASLINVDLFLILTDVRKVAINFGSSNERTLDELDVAQAKKYLGEGQFPPGSMGPKIEASIRFVETTGKKAVISSLEEANEAVEGRAGTNICLG